MRGVRLRWLLGVVGALVVASASPTAALASGPVNSLAPVITGSPVVGSALTATNGSWFSQNLPDTFSYAWYDCYTSSFSTC